MSAEIEILIKAQNQATAAFQSAKGDMEQMERSSKSMGESMKAAAADMRNMGLGLTAGVTLPIVGVAVAAVKSAGDFEQAMNVMQQVSGSTEAQMELMQAQALQSWRCGLPSPLGKAADAMLELAKAGMSTAEVSAAIGGTLDLAAAGGLDLATAAEVSANAVNAFNLEASDSVRVANMLAAAANASSVDVHDLAMGMKMAGAVFSSSGQSIDDLTTGLLCRVTLASRGLTLVRLSQDDVAALVCPDR